MKRSITPPAPLFLDRRQFRQDVTRLDIDGLIDLDDLIERFGCLAERDQDDECTAEAHARREIIDSELRRRGWRPRVYRPLAVAS